MLGMLLSTVWIWVHRLLWAGEKNTHTQANQRVVCAMHGAFLSEKNIMHRPGCGCKTEQAY